MSGHSKWHNIQHKKGAADAARSGLFTKLAREITMAAKLGDKNPDNNPRLRLAILTARKNSMPNDNIKRAIELDNNDALACSMQGNVEFYSPFGSKKKALAYYQRADSLYQEGAKEYEQWNRCAVQLTMVQCLIKQEKKKEAKRLCEQYIAKEPAFELMKQLLKQCD